MSHPTERLQSTIDQAGADAHFGIPVQAESDRIRKQHRPLHTLCQALDPSSFVDHPADQTERKTVLGADVAEDHLAEIQSNTERKVLPNIGIGVL